MTEPCDLRDAGSLCAHTSYLISHGGISALLHKHRQVAGLYGIQEANLSLLEISIVQDCLVPYLFGDDTTSMI